MGSQYSVCGCYLGVVLVLALTHITAHTAHTAHTADRDTQYTVREAREAQGDRGLCGDHRDYCQDPPNYPYSVIMQALQRQPWLVNTSGLLDQSEEKRNY